MGQAALLPRSVSGFWFQLSMVEASRCADEAAVILRLKIEVLEVLPQRLFRPLLLRRNSTGLGRLNVTAAKVLPDFTNHITSLLHLRLLLPQLECQQCPILRRQQLAATIRLLLSSLQLSRPTAAQFARQWLAQKLQLFPLSLEDALDLGATELGAHPSSMRREGPRAEEKVHRNNKVITHWHQSIGWQRWRAVLLRC